MRRRIGLWIASVGLLLGVTSLARAQDGAPQVFTIPALQLEDGATLSQARVEYATYGRLNAAKDNVVLTPSHYMADSHGYEWLIGPGKALDPAKYFVVSTECSATGGRHPRAIRRSRSTARVFR